MTPRIPSANLPETLKNLSYHLIFIPSDNRQVRRFQVSESRFKLFGFGVSLFVTVSLFSLAGLWYYRSAYRNLVTERSKDREFLQEKLALTSKIQRLERDVERTEQFAAKLEVLVGIPASDLEKGIGPLSPSPSVQASVGQEGLWEGSRIQGLQEKANVLETRINEAYESYQDRSIFLASTPSIWPVKGWITSEYGMRINPLRHHREMHEGLDVAAQWGTTIVAPADGIVTFAGPHGGFGKTVKIEHGYGIATMYGHASQLHVRSGQKVRRGTKIASIGSTGKSTGPHLHYEIHVDGVPIDPAQYILR